MITVNRKLIEEYYKDEWSKLLSVETVSLLIELTCKGYHLNQPKIPNFVKLQESLVPTRLAEL